MIVGFTTAGCPFCHAEQPFLHLHTKPPCLVRCGRCGARGPLARTPDEAVGRWNECSTGSMHLHGSNAKAHVVRRQVTELEVAK